MNRTARLAIALLLVAAGASPARAQAWMRWEQDPRGMALAGATTANDGPSAAFYNPAGLAWLFGTDVEAVAAASVHDARLVAFGRGAFDRGVAPDVNPALYVSHTLAQRVTGGLAFNAPWGLAVDWPEPAAFAGRFLATRARLGSVEARPVLAWQPARVLSVGAGVEVLHVVFDLDRFEEDPALSALGGGGPIALARSTFELAGSAIGWSAGAQFRPSDRLTVGVAGRGEIGVSLDGRVDMTVVAPAELREETLPSADGTIGEFLDRTYVDQPARTFLVFPRVLSVGASWEPRPRVRLLGDLQWTGWGAADSIRLAFSDPTLDRQIPLNYDDTWAVRVGGEYRWSPRLVLRAGYSILPSPAPSGGVTPLVPDADRKAVSAGAGIRWADFVVDVGYRAALLDDRRGVVFPGNPGSDGIYEAVEHRVSVALRRRF